MVKNSRICQKYIRHPVITFMKNKDEKLEICQSRPLLILILRKLFLKFAFINLTENTGCFLYFTTTISQSVPFKGRVT